MLTISCSPHHLTQASEMKHSDIGQMAAPTSPDTVVLMVLESLQHEELFQRGQGQWPHLAAGQVAEEKSSVSPCGHGPRLSPPIRPVDDPLEQWGFEGG